MSDQQVNGVATINPTANPAKAPVKGDSASEELVGMIEFLQKELSETKAKALKESQESAAAVAAAQQAAKQAAPGWKTYTFLPLAGAAVGAAIATGITYKVMKP